MMPYIAGMKLWLAEMTEARAPEESARLGEEGRGPLQAEGVREPARFARVYVPGLGAARV